MEVDGRVIGHTTMTGGNEPIVTGIVYSIYVERRMGSRKRSRATKTYGAAEGEAEAILAVVIH